MSPRGRPADAPPGHLDGPAGSFWRAAVAEAVRAPSSHNTQPWLFRLDGPVVEVLADRSRALPVNDPDDRELTISCGAALFTLRVGLAALGRDCAVDPLPERGDDDVLARVTVGSGPPDGELARLADAVGLRHTVRSRFTDRAVDPGVLAATAGAVEEEGCSLMRITGEGRRERLLHLVAAGDRSQFRNAAWRRELASWIRARRDGQGLQMSALAVPAARLVVSRVDLGRRMARRDVDLAEHSPVLAILSSTGDGPVHWLAAGQAVQRMLLVAARAGVQASFLNQACQVPVQRLRLRELLPEGQVPQLVLRLGHPATSPRPASRRAVADVILPARPDLAAR